MLTDYEEHANTFSEEMNSGFHVGSLTDCFLDCSFSQILSPK
jgi:hypothetical protein